MKLGIDWQQNSTKRGAVWVVFAVVGMIGWWTGKDIAPLMVLAGAVAGGLGVALKDE